MENVPTDILGEFIPTNNISKLLDKSSMDNHKAKIPEPHRKYNLS